MYKLSEQTKRNISITVGIPYEKLITMDDDKIVDHIEKKTGRKIKFSKTKARFKGSGDDSVLIDLGRIRTIEDVDNKINAITKQIRKTRPLISEKDDILIDL